ncbi:MULTISPECIES: ribosome silencing factor [Caproicibacterium]|jgi:ribosome-associated protein|uniref:Ribosomal silencing factor RsfS n=1 Tax=Caproicibacterium lactatifermentans TaxID=2666138 RepID=A0A859DP97_9FIRM|nr:ribosome silencing factor [Caproicibacterium lactatifermentans]ARP50402.1 ribosome silencing factor [Ruminococcaceae bacterium CPB6]QKN23877.1 ribosome silencing factor [Caproicibacterium lactatifermentans]QKO31053.1 ribosome silencing factor [Caproicibacterium lactatifermentans]
MEPITLAQEAVKILDKKKAQNIKLIGIEDISSLANYFLLANGTSSTHVKALADEVEYQLKQKNIVPDHVEGYRSHSWVLMDYGAVVIHIFTQDARDFYDLDRLWKDGEQVDISGLLTAD